jgi:hypothetical protein
VTRAGLVLGAGAVLLAGGVALPRAEGDEQPAPPPAVQAAAQKTAPAPEAAREKLVGVWMLNAELSDDPRVKMREGGGGRGPGGPGGGGYGDPGGGGYGPPGGGGGRGAGPPGGGGGRGGMGGGMGGPSGPGGPPDGGAYAQPMAFGDQVTVTNLQPEITMIDPEGEIRRLHADEKAYKDSSGSEVKTRWEGAFLVVETKTGRGKVRETWSVTDSPRRLTVLVKMARPFGGEISVKRVFDASTIEAARRPPSP